MRIIATVQARMSSRRLPGKVLASAGGRTVLQLLVERLRRCRDIDGFVIATSTQPDDDAIARWCRAHDVPCHRGPLQDVAARLLGAAREAGADAVDRDALVRVCADSPLLDPSLIDRAAGLYRRGDFDLVTNVHPRTFPRGQSVEVVGCALLAAALPWMSPTDREHVTPLLYRRVDPERVHRLIHPVDRSDRSLVVDTSEDLESLRRLLHSMNRPQWQYGLDEILALEQCQTTLA